MRPRPFLLLIAGFALALMAAGEADAEPDDMVAHWSFDEGEGTTAYDSSGNGNDGTLENGVQWVDGVVGGALEFDGENDYVALPSSLGSETIDSGSWAFGINPGDISSSTSRVMGYTSNWAQDKQWLFWLKEFGDYNNITFSITANGEGGTGWSPRVNASISTGVWTHIVGTWDGTHIRIFKNGSAISETEATGELGDTSSPIRMGSTGGEKFDGGLDEVTIWDRALSSEEISELYESYGQPDGDGGGGDEDGELFLSAPSLAAAVAAVAVIALFRPRKP